MPQAYVYPAAMRSTRDLLRRRLHLVRKRGQRLAHIQNTRAQYNFPSSGGAWPIRRISILAHKIGRAVFYLLSRGTVFSMDRFRAA